MKNLPITSEAKSIKDHSERGDFFKFRSSILSLSDGTSFDGFSPTWQDRNYVGEVVFNTGMTGYVESLTDPSYTGQILVFTFPLIGNYGALDNRSWEGDQVHVAGVVMSEACQNWSHSGSRQSLLAWLHDQHIPVMSGVDTRALTRHLRSQGTMLGAIGKTKAKTSELKSSLPRVSIKSPTMYNESHTKQVILVDCGLKQSILRSLLDLPVKVKRVPYDYDYTVEDFDGVLLSNGPGDPTDYPETVAIAQKAMAKDKPMFGICLGTQIMGLAAGAQTYKLAFGHRGHNQPCIARGDKCYITSQNHGYAIDETTLPKDWSVSFRNLNDNSVEGIAHAHSPFFAVQFHPEASPGPTDTQWLFDKFYQSL